MTRDVLATRIRRTAWQSALLVVFSPLVFRQAPLLAQQDARLRAQHDTLERIRREREALERRAADLQSTVHDLNEEVTNIDRRAEATARIVKTLETQLETISAEVNDASSRVNLTENELAAKKTSLNHRLIDIYKRGPLFTTEVMLSAHSFGELVARYKYLHLLALRDRALVHRVEQLHEQVQRDRDRLVTLQNVLVENRSDKQREEEHLRALERERGASLAATRRQAKATLNRIAEMNRTETILGSSIAAYEASRRKAESAKSATLHTAVGSTIKTSDYGKLDWPVDGSLVYTFGKAQTASNTTIRWNGVGIKAAVNTGVHTVAAGTVVSVGQLGTYGLTVIVDHGGGDYSIYGSLSHADVKRGQVVAKGQVIGGVGMSDPDLPAHLHFEIRHGGADGRTPAVDPATWLRDQR